MNGFEIFGVVLLSMLAGAEIGSFVEYKKKYNLYDLEQDKVLGLVHTLLNHVGGMYASAGKTIDAVEKAL